MFKSLLYSSEIDFDNKIMGVMGLKYGFLFSLGIGVVRRIFPR